MTAFIITPDAGVIKSGNFESAFQGDTAAADSLLVEQGAFLFSTGFLGIGAALTATNAWKVTILGSLYAPQGVGLILFSGNAKSSTITVAEEGSIHGGLDGMLVDSIATVRNYGMIFGETNGIRTAAEAGIRTILNYGSISGGTHAIFDDFGVSTDRVTNAGEIVGNVDLSGGDDTLINTGLIQGDVHMGDGNNLLENTGLIDASSGGARGGNGVRRQII